MRWAALPKRLQGRGRMQVYTRRAWLHGRALPMAAHSQPHSRRAQQPTNRNCNSAPLHTQDVNCFVSEADPGTSYSVAVAPGRQAYIVCIEGSIALAATSAASGANSTQAAAEEESVVLAKKDAARVLPSKKRVHGLGVQCGDKGAHFLLIEMCQRPS